MRHAKLIKTDAPGVSFRQRSEVGVVVVTESLRITRAEDAVTFKVISNWDIGNITHTSEATINLSLTDAGVVARELLPPATLYVRPGDLELNRSPRVLTAYQIPDAEWCVPLYTHPPEGVTLTKITGEPRQLPNGGGTLRTIVTDSPEFPDFAPATLAEQLRAAHRGGFGPEHFPLLEQAADELERLRNTCTCPLHGEAPE